MDKLREFCTEYSNGTANRVVVIGAGAAGLSALGALRRRGHSDVLLLEKDAALGGIWRQCDYPDLSIHTKSFSYRFYNFPAPSSRSEHATRQEILDYFQAYVNSFQLDKYILYRIRVTKIIYLEDDRIPHRCELHIEDEVMHTTHVIRCSYVICALGFTNAGTPNLPVLPGQKYFRGKQCHAIEVNEAMFNDIRERGSSVCLLGGGKSAYDLALQFTKRGLSQQITWIYEKFLWGLNYDFLYYSGWRELSKAAMNYHYYLYALRRQPDSINIRSMAQEIVKTGLLTNIDENNLNIHETRSAIYKPSEIALLRSSTKRVRTWAQSLGLQTISLENGSEVLADYVIYCTGFGRAGNLLSIERKAIDGRTSVADPRNQKMLYRGMIDANFPEIIFFAGEALFGQQLFGFSIAGEWVAQFIKKIEPHNRDALKRDVEFDDIAINGGVRPEFGYSWISNGSKSGGCGYLIGEASVRYLQQIFHDLGIDEGIVTNLYASLADQVGFEGLARRIEGQLRTALA